MSADWLFVYLFFSFLFLGSNLTAFKMSSSIGIISKTSPMVQTASSSESRLIRFSHTWTIDNFSHRIAPSSRDSLQTSNFSFSPEEKQKFALLMYPNGENEESNGYLSLFLVNTYNYGTPIVGCKFSILNDKGSKCNVRETQQKLNYQLYNNTKYSERQLGFEKFVSKYELFTPSKGFLPNNKLTIYVETNSTSTVYNSTSIGMKNSNDVLDVYANLLKSGELSDVVLAVSGTEFRAHKLVLSARSPVFRAMFEHDLMEKQTNCVEITDVKSDVFQQLLSYIYTGKVDLDEKNVQDLFTAADKYQLLALKSKCEKNLCAKVSLQTAPNLLLLAESCNADNLKTSVLSFMKRQSFETIQDMMKAKPEVLICMFGFLAIKNEK